MAVNQKAQVTKALAKIKADEKWRERLSYYKKWPRYENYTAGIFEGQSEGIRPVNLYFPILRTIIPQVYFQNPGATITSDIPGFEFKALVVEALDNWLADKLGIKHELKAAGRDCFHCGTGVLQHGYDSEWGMMAGIDTAGAELTPTAMNKKKQPIEYSTNIIPGMPWSVRQHPRDVLFDWGCTSPRRIRRFTVRRLRLLEDVKQDEKYDASARGLVQATTKGTSPDEPGVIEVTDSGEEWVLIWTIHDIKAGKVMDIAQGSEKFLRYEDDVLSSVLGAPPVTPIIWNENTRSVWGIPDARMIEDYQLEINNVNTLFLKDLRQSIPKGIYDSDAFDEDDLEKFETELPNAMIGITGGVNPDTMHFFGTKDLSHYRLIMEGIKRDAREAIGLSETRSGAFTAPAKRVTGKEISAVERGSDIGVYAKRDTLSDALKDTFQKWNQFIFKYWKKPRFIRIPSEVIPYEWIVFRGTDLAGGYTYTVHPDDMEAVTRESRKQEAAQLGPLLMKIAQNIPDADRTAILKGILRRFPDWDAGEILPMMREIGLDSRKTAILTPEGNLVPLEGGGPREVG